MLFVTEESHTFGISFEVNEKCKWNTRARVNFGNTVLTQLTQRIIRNRLMYDDHPTKRRNLGRPKKRWKDLHPYRWHKPGTAYTRLLLMMVTNCKIYSWKNECICHVTVFRHVTSYTRKHTGLPKFRWKLLHLQGQPTTVHTYRLYGVTSQKQLIL
jgi:hypothetical protein